VKVLVGLATLLFSAVFVAVVAHKIPVGWDFGAVFRPAARNLLAGKSPYEVRDFFSPVWAAILFIPFALLPEPLAWGLFLYLNVVVYLVALVRMKAKRLDLILFFLSPFVFYSIRFGNIDSFVLLGVTLPPFIGIWLLALKPQMTIGLLLFLAYQACREGWKKMLALFVPLSLAILVSLAMSSSGSAYPFGVSWNVNLWPWGVPIGIAILLLALRYKRRFAMLASGPFLSPYVAIQSWMVTLPAAFGTRWLIVGWGLGWGVVAFRATLGEAGSGYEQILIGVWGLLLIFSEVRRSSHKSPTESDTPALIE
jgi:hypothetical protein